MSFELRIAAQRAPREPPSAAETGVAPRAPATVLTVNGELNDAGLADVLQGVRRAFESDSDSVVVELQDVVLDDGACLAPFAEHLMAERAMGRHVQVVARQSALHTLCAALPGARDWLIADCRADVGGGRRALHVDRPCDSS